MTWLDFGGQKSQQGVKVVKASTSMLGHRIHFLVSWFVTAFSLL